MAKKNSIKLHYETVTPLLKKILNEIMKEPVFAPFYLVGGTSLSLRLGHRKSIDIDLFTNASYGSLDFSVYENFFQNNYKYYDCTDKTDIVGFGRSYYIGESEDNNIKVDLFYHDEIINPCDIIDGIRIASLADVTAMKVDVVSRGGRKKDFWDLHELLNTYTIPEMLELHKKRYEYTHDREQIIANFVDFSSADKDIDPICLKGKEWKLIKLDFVELMDQNP
ncbi:MAG: nucleotidyl transferase AbiEii/AbiGii toxin family protein [Petrimonas sp.]|uniref:nucleotidyl transferase AbiEii/AbiGii toxin family protein n=1 Tax=Petrimonas sp. TaxID=2023866 RepID=UPI002B3BE9FD|nr:nucleotidyl transferase AbiEii/AbiGii toxin family protein [Petrimonas sp.]MEA4978998.1 nucleotidyl transferase AbiEii/AbiGii toxin family protein [Petrimonas sp.]MEA5044923.1 nucleotidyl transferase AbiEii/AbiGii toxin family protein [Petrimonas sp.]